VCESNDHFIHECSDPKKRGDKDKRKDKKRKIYFKSDKKEKAFLGMPDCSNSSSDEDEEEEHHGMVGVAIASSSSPQASTPPTKASSPNSAQASTSSTKYSSSSLSLFTTKFSDFKHVCLMACHVDVCLHCFIHKMI
jgi:hypothetical protein